jgi:hypothetical protein
MVDRQRKGGRRTRKTKGKTTFLFTEEEKEVSCPVESTFSTAGVSDDKHSAISSANNQTTEPLWPRFLCKSLIKTYLTVFFLTA